MARECEGVWHFEIHSSATRHTAALARNVETRHRAACRCDRRRVEPSVCAETLYCSLQSLNSISTSSQQWQVYSARVLHDRPEVGWRLLDTFLSCPPPFPHSSRFETVGRRPRADAGVQYGRVLHLSIMLTCSCETTNSMNLKEAVDTEELERDEPESTVSDGAIVATSDCTCHLSIPFLGIGSRFHPPSLMGTSPQLSLPLLVGAEAEGH